MEIIVGNVPFWDTPNKKNWIWASISLLNLYLILQGMDDERGDRMIEQAIEARRRAENWKTFVCILMAIAILFQIYHHIFVRPRIYDEIRMFHQQFTCVNSYKQ